MADSKLVNIIKKISNGTSKHSPLLLSGIAIAGLITTVVLAVKATPKTLNELELEKEYQADETGEMPENIILSKKDILRLSWKNYIPAAISGIATITCIIGSHKISSRRIASISGLYSVTSAAFDEYKEKVIEKLGKNTHQKIKDDIDKDHIDNSEINDQNPVIITGDGDMLCYDSYSGRYFKSNAEKIRRTENILNRKILHENTVCLNDVYYEWKLPNIKIGYDVGWNANHLIEFAFSSQLMNGETPVLVIDYVVAPYHDYEKY